MDRGVRVVPREDGGSIGPSPCHELGSVLAQTDTMAEARTIDAERSRRHFEFDVGASQRTPSAGEIENALQLHR